MVLCLPLPDSPGKGDTNGLLPVRPCGTSLLSNLVSNLTGCLTGVSSLGFVASPHEGIPNHFGLVFCSSFYSNTTITEESKAEW